MPNMSYCRFENTYQDLSDCYEHMDDTDLSEREAKYRHKLLKLVLNIYYDFAQEMFESEEEDA